MADGIVKSVTGRTARALAVMPPLLTLLAPIAAPSQPAVPPLRSSVQAESR